jgi:ATP-dependent Clp protease, protease subunit
MKKMPMMKMMTSPVWNVSRAGNNAELTIYSPIEAEEYWWSSTVTPKGVMREMDKLGNVDQITVRINSPGGDVFAGLAIYEYLKNHKARIVTRNDGLAASAASIILMAGDEIIMGTGSMVMIHNPYTIAMGEAKDFLAAADMLGKIQQSLISVYKERTGKNEEELKAMMDATTWMTADDSISLGFADKVDRKERISATIQNGLAKVGNQCFDLRVFAMAPPLPHEEEDDADDGGNGKESEEGEDTVKNLQELQNKYPDIYKEAVSNAVKMERERLAAIDELAEPGFEEIITSAKASGASAADTAVLLVKAQKEQRAKALGHIVTDAANSGLDLVTPSAAHVLPAAEKEQAQVEAQVNGLAAALKKMRGV